MVQACYPTFLPELESGILQGFAEDSIRPSPRYIGGIVLSAFNTKAKIPNVASFRKIISKPFLDNGVADRRIVLVIMNIEKL